MSTPDQKRLHAAYYPLGNYQEKVMIFLKSHAGDIFEFNASILAVRQIDSWKLQPIDTDLPAVGARLGSPKDSNFSNDPVFTVPAVVSGSPEGSAYLDVYRAVVERYESTEQELVKEYRTSFEDNSNKSLALLAKHLTLSGILTANIGYKIRGTFSLIKDNEGTPTITPQQPDHEIPAVFEVQVATSASAQSDVDVVTSASNPMVLELTQPGFLREIPKLITGSVDDPSPGGAKGYLRIEGKRLSGTTAGTFTFPISFTLP